MKILFLVPPALDGCLAAERIFGCNYGIYPQNNVFILYPATILKNKGHDVACLDLTAKLKGKADFEELCKDNNFEIVVFYTVFLSKKTDLLARDKLIKGNSRLKFIFLSTEPTASPDDFIDDYSIVIRGEPESRIVSVAAALEGKMSLSEIPGISYRREGKNIHQGGCEVINDLDSLPVPDRSLFEKDCYYNPKLNLRPFATMIASRGCSFNCYYCVPNSLDFAREIEFKRGHPAGKPAVRLRSPEKVVEEFGLLSRLGYRSISFLDDQFVWGEERTLEICGGIAPFKIDWSCLARADMLKNEKVTQAMARAGCKYIAIGVESFNQKILDYIGKGCKVEAFYSAVKNLREAGIGIELNILLGSCPLETKETIRETFKEVLRLKPDYVLFSICTPFPYTEFSSRAKTNGWIINQEYSATDPMKEAFISYPHLTKTELDGIIRKLYRSYYLRPGYILEKTLSLKGITDFRDKLSSGIRILK